MLAAGGETGQIRTTWGKNAAITDSSHFTKQAPDL